MKQITVKTSTKYEVYINAGLIGEIGKIVSTAAGGHNALLVTDTNVGPLYGRAAADSLRAAGYDVHIYVMPAGEENKNIEIFGDILRRMAESRLTREDVAVALGGGVVGDITGFAASSYMRGINYVQVPTTVLAAVDSSVGGKTGIDLPEGKNLAGAFWQPKAVICDTDTFKTLPDREYNSGFAEVIKYAMIADEDLINELDDDIDSIIYRCIQIKADIVSEDEFESGKRKLLNFGHTIGHALEKASGFAMSHGEAVAVGMTAMCNAAIAEGVCSHLCRDRLVDALAGFSLPTAEAFDRETVARNILSDKKAQGNGIDIIMPLNIGRCTVKHISFEDIPVLLKKAGF